MLMSGQQGKLYKKTITDDGTITAFERIDPVINNPSYNFINQFVLDPATNNKLYLCHSNRLWRNNDLAGIPLTGNYYSANSTNWEQLSTTNQSNRISALDISAAAPNTLFLGTNNGRVHRIDSLDATPVNDQSGLNYLVATHRPGDTLHLQVRNQAGQTRSLDVRAATPPSSRRL